MKKEARRPVKACKQIHRSWCSRSCVRIGRSRLAAHRRFSQAVVANVTVRGPLRAAAMRESTCCSLPAAAAASSRDPFQPATTPRCWGQKTAAVVSAAAQAAAAVREGKRGRREREREEASRRAKRSSVPAAASSLTRGRFVAAFAAAAARGGQGGASEPAAARQLHHRHYTTTTEEKGPWRHMAEKFSFCYAVRRRQQQQAGRPTRSRAGIPPRRSQEGGRVCGLFGLLALRPFPISSFPSSSSSSLLTILAHGPSAAAIKEEVRRRSRGAAPLGSTAPSARAE